MTGVKVHFCNRLTDIRKNKYILFAKFPNFFFCRLHYVIIFYNIQFRGCDYLVISSCLISHTLFMELGGLFLLFDMYQRPYFCSIFRILKALLNELMEKSVLGKHPKLMLRRYVLWCIEILYNCCRIQLWHMYVCLKLR